MDDQVKFNEFGEVSNIEAPTKNIENVTDETCLNNTDDLGSTIMEENNEYGKPDETFSDSTDDPVTVQKNSEDTTQLNNLEDLTEKTKFGEVSTLDEHNNVEDETDETYFNDMGNTNDFDCKIMLENNDHDETFSTIKKDETILVQKTDDVTQLNNTEAHIENNDFGEASNPEEYNNKKDDETDETSLYDLNNIDNPDSTLPQENIEYYGTSSTNLSNDTTIVQTIGDVIQLKNQEYLTDKNEFSEASTIDEHTTNEENATDESCLIGLHNTDDLKSTLIQENNEYDKTSSAITTIVQETEGIIQLNNLEDQIENIVLGDAFTIDENTNNVEDANEKTCLNDSDNTDDLNSTFIQENKKYAETSITDPKRKPPIILENEDVAHLNDEIDNTVKPECENSEYHQKTDGQTKGPKRTAAELRKHVFRDPSTYKEFIPRISFPSEEDGFNIRSGETASTSSLYDLPKVRDPKKRKHTFQTDKPTGRRFGEAPQHYNHSFVATIDAFLLILEGTLAGLYRISQNHTGPPIPPVVANSMQSVRLSLETLRVHFGYTPQENFEPIASILRDLLTPAIDLFAKICPELNPPDNLDFYSPLLVPISQPTVPIVPKQKSKPEYLVTPSEIHGTTIYHRHPVPTPHTPPRIPLFMNMSQDPNLGIFATADGMLRVNLPFTFQIDITLDGAILMRNFRDRTFAAISTCGSQSGIHTDLCRAYQHGKITEIRITDEIARKNMYAKIGVRGIKFGGTGTPANLHLKENGNMVVAEYSFRNLEHDYIKEIFLDYTHTYGPSFYEICSAALQECRSKTLVDGSLHFCWRDITITQFRNGELIISRNGRDFIIWCSPEIIHPYTGTEKKGMIRVVTPMSRISCTVMSTPVKENEKFFLTNLDRNWVYYTARAFVISNEVHSAGYGLTLREITELHADSNISI